MRYKLGVYMTEIDFYPAVMVGHFNRITSQPDKKQFRFWGEGSLVKYDKFLYSFYYLQDRYKKLEKGKSYFESIGYDGKIMLDSGGWQIHSLGAKINPEDVISVYEREIPNIGMILDVPLDNGWNDDGVKNTYNNVKYMVENKHRIPKTELLNVSHGLTIAERKKYYDIFKEFNNDLDGWSIGLIKRLPPIFNIWSFMYIISKDETMKNKRFHFLGLTGNKNIPLIYYLAKLNLVKSISFDSTKYGREGIMADIRNPSFLGERLSISKNAFGELESNKFCPCPVCQNTPMKEMKADVNYSILHNLFWEIKKFEFFNSFKTAEDLKNHIMNSKEFHKDTRTAIKFIDCCLENGIEEAEKKFVHELIVKTPPKIVVEKKWW